MPSVDKAWFDVYTRVNKEGTVCHPRGMAIREIPHLTVEVDMRYPVLRNTQRKLSYRFMGAEAWWILSGRRDVASIEPYNPNIAQFSDDGEVFFGAYGPPIRRQLAYVVGKLICDRDTRQATMTIWQPNPPKTKDVPCTIALDFKIRNNKLNCHVFMRSSDVWLGLPYDVFNFSMIAAYVRAWLHTKLNKTMPVELGMLYLTAASSHLYEKHWDQPITEFMSVNIQVPDDFIRTPDGLLENLKTLADSKPDGEIRWWRYW